MTGVRSWVGRDGVAATARNVYVAQAFSNIVSAIDVASAVGGPLTLALGSPST